MRLAFAFLPLPLSSFDFRPSDGSAAVHRTTELPFPTLHSTACTARCKLDACTRSSIGISGLIKPAYRRARLVLKSHSPPCPSHPTPLLLPPPSLLLGPCLGSRSDPGRLGPGLGLSARAVTALLAPAHIRMPSAHRFAWAAQRQGRRGHQGPH